MSHVVHIVSMRTLTEDVKKELEYNYLCLSSAAVLRSALTKLESVIKAIDKCVYYEGLVADVNKMLCGPLITELRDEIISLAAPFTGAPTLELPADGRTLTTAERTHTYVVHVLSCMHTAPTEPTGNQSNPVADQLITRLVLIKTGMMSNIKEIH